MRSNMALGAKVDGVDVWGGDASITDVGDRPMVSMPALELERGTVLAGRYQIEAVIGSGGSGVVLRAFDRIAQTPVALKILKPELAAEPRWAERFARELRLGRQIQHPNVCRVYDIGEADGHRFLSMELATGGTLRDVRCEKPTRPFAERVADARALVSGMAAIHAAGIIHRDVKPENLLRMEDGRVVVSDFGLATNPEQAPTVTVMVGTPSYMAPEMAMGDPASKTSDVWALGVTMHEILFGKRPEWDMISGQREFRTPPECRDSVSRMLARLCAQCAAETPAQRPLDAEAILRRFCRAVGGSVLSGQYWNGLSRVGRMNAGWGVLAVGVLGALFATRSLWTSAAASQNDRHDYAPVTLQGRATDWSTSSVVLAKFHDKVHCVAALEKQQKVRVVWGSPRHAEDVDLFSGSRSASDLRPETFQDGCPQLSPVGSDVLFERFDPDGRRQLFLSPNGDGSEARSLTFGTDPVWLRNGREFVYTLDDSHAAVFSLPLMSSAIVNDGFTGARSVVGKTVSGDGNLLAVRYVDPAYRKLLTIHRLPTLEVVDRLAFVKASKEVSFLDSSGRMLFSHEENDGVSVIEFDWKTRQGRRLGMIQGADLREPMPWGDRFVFIARRITSDIWRYQDGSPAIQLTRGGLSSNPDGATNGDVLMEYAQPNGDYVIRLYDSKTGKHENLTDGPTDLSPSFMADGVSWLYVKANRQEIVRCALTDRSSCRVVHAAGVLPMFPVASPDGTKIAYLSAVSRSRIFVVLQSAEPVDLGPARMDCAPRWSSNDHLWVLQGSDKFAEWIEIDTKNGNRTGGKIPAGISNGYRYGCPYGVFPPATTTKLDVRAVTHESDELRIR